MIVDIDVTLYDAHEMGLFRDAMAAIEDYRRKCGPTFVNDAPTFGDFSPAPIPVVVRSGTVAPGVVEASPIPASANLVTVAMLETELRGFLSRNAGDIAKARALLDKYNLERISGADTLTDDQRVRLRAELSA